MSEIITKLKYKKNGIVETIYPVTHVDAIVGNMMLSKVVNVVASTAQTNFWGNPIRYKVPQTSSGNSSIVMLINAENTSSAGSEKYLGIMEMNILATGSNQTNGSNLNWLVVHGFEKENFHLRHLKSADEILLWVKPTVGNLTITILSETTNGEATNNAILIDKPALTTVTSTTIVGNKLSDSQFLVLDNTISGFEHNHPISDIIGLQEELDEKSIIKVSETQPVVTKPNNHWYKVTETIGEQTNYGLAPFIDTEPTPDEEIPYIETKPMEEI